MSRSGGLILFSNVWSSCGLVSSLFFSLFVVGSFLWNFTLLGVLPLFFPFIYVVFVEVIRNKDAGNFYSCEMRPHSFWIFLGTEVLAFGSLFVCFFWYFEGDVSISSHSGYSLAGTASLLCSSMWATAWHRCICTDLGSETPEDNAFVLCRRGLVESDAQSVILCDSWFEGSSFIYPVTCSSEIYKSHFVFLALSVVFGLFFLCLQFAEFSNCSSNMTSSSTYGVFYATVGLHFMHVALGVSGLSLYGMLFGASGVYYYASIICWYWHFVDYVWLWLYLLFYFV